MILMYRSALAPTPPVDWPALFKLNLPLAFPAADPQGMLALQLYLSAGGSIKDDQGRPSLQVEPLTETLKVFADGLKQGTFSERAGPVPDRRAGRPGLPRTAAAGAVAGELEQPLFERAAGRYPGGGRAIAGGEALHPGDRLGMGAGRAGSRTAPGRGEAGRIPGAERFPGAVDGCRRDTCQPAPAPWRAGRTRP